MPMMPIDRSHPTPLYFQIKSLLLEQILAGEYEAGDRLPTEHELCEQLDVSRTPVSRALSELAKEGVILRHRKRGSFVNPHWVRRAPRSTELRLLVPDGPWESLARNATEDDLILNVASVAFDNLRDVAMRSVAEGRAPDLALVDSVWVPELAASGFLWPLEDLDADWLELEYLSDFLEPLMEVSRYEGKTYGVHAAADIAGLWYRHNHLDSLGLDPPKTWNELLYAARSIRDLNGEVPTPIVMPGGLMAGETTTYCLLAILASNGATMMDERGISLDSRQTVETLRFLRELIEQRLMPREVVAFDRERPVRLLAEGRATFMFGGSYEGADLASLIDEDLTSLWDHYGFVPVPAGPSGGPAVLAGGMTYVIFRQAQRPKAAMAFLEHLLSQTPLTELALRTGQIPPRRKAALDVGEKVPLVAASTGMLRHASVRPATVEHVRVSAQLQSMLAAVLTGSLGPAAATERTAEFLGAITGLSVIHESSVSSAPDEREL